METETVRRIPRINIAISALIVAMLVAWGIWQPRLHSAAELNWNGLFVGYICLFIASLMGGLQPWRTSMRWATEEMSRKVVKGFIVPPIHYLMNWFTFYTIIYGIFGGLSTIANIVLGGICIFLLYGLRWYYTEVELYKMRVLKSTHVPAPWGTLLGVTIPLFFASVWYLGYVVKVLWRFLPQILTL